MKKKSKHGFILYYLSILFLVALYSNAYSQEQEQSGLSFGAKVGLASSTFTTTQFMDAGSIKNGLQASVVANYSILSYLDVSLEVMYSNTGASNISPEYFYTGENSVLTNKIVNTSIVSNQLCIPLLLSYVFSESPKGVFPRIYAGGDISFNLKTNALNTYKASFNGSNIYPTTFESMGNRVAKNDFGAIIGSVLSIGDGPIIYTIDARYRVGLTNINETNSTFIESTLKRNTFSIMFGIMYQL